RVSEILSGKFFAVLLPTVSTIVVLFPPFALLMILQNVNWAMDPGPWMLIVVAKFLISATFYIAVSLVCSYYSANARAALVISYVMLGLYALLNYALWNYLLIPALFSPNYYQPDPYYSYSTNYTNGSPWATDNNHFSLTPIELVHMVQAGLLGGL